MVHCYTNIFGNINYFSPIFKIFLFKKILQYEYGQALFCACYFASTQNYRSPFSDTQTQNRHPLATPLPPIAENSDNYDRICCFLCCMFLLSLRLVTLSIYLLLFYSLCCLHSVRGARVNFFYIVFGQTGGQ